MLDKASAIPLHTQLADLLRKQIRSKELPPKTRLPSERELCQMHDISRITVRKALEELQHENLIYPSVGKGTYVNEPALQEKLQPLSSFTEDMARRGMAASSQVLEASILPAEDDLMKWLNVPRFTDVVKLHRLRLADRLPIAIQFSYLPHHLCPGLLNYDFSACSLYDVLRRQYGLNLSRADTILETRLAKPDERQLLGLAYPAAVLLSEQTTYLDSNVVIEFTISIFCGDRYKLYTSIY